MLAMHMECLGEVPLSLILAARYRRTFFNERNQPLYCHVVSKKTGELAGKAVNGLYRYAPGKRSFHKMFRHRDPSFLDFMENILCFDPKKRLSASEALQHPWITGERLVKRQPSTAMKKDLPAHPSNTRLSRKVCSAAELLPKVQEIMGERLHPAVKMNRALPSLFKIVPAPSFPKLHHLDHEKKSSTLILPKLPAKKPSASRKQRI